MKRLNIEINTNGHHYKLLRRSEQVALYRQLHPESGQLVGYELFKINIRPLEIISGKEFPLRETFSKNSDWGTTAWTLSCKLTEEEAIERFEEYVKKVENK